jgi:predicted glycoside hydrolase/deacetylase ChbG (UPF0249 family)
MRSLLIHADDFGLSEGVSAGIMQAISAGAVTATSAMICSPEHRARVARLAPALPGRVGLHLQLTDGIPVSDPALIPTLVDGTGRFPRRREQLGAMDSAEVLIEWRAQLQAIRQAGIEPSHVDTHHSVHALPPLADVYLAFAQEAGVPARGGNTEFSRWMRTRGAWCADAYVCFSTGTSVTLSALHRILRVMAAVTPPEASIEIGCHPAIVDEGLDKQSRYVEPRGQELSALTDPGLREKIDSLGYRLITPAELPRRIVNAATSVIA